MHFCTSCRSEFGSSEQDRAFYQELAVPAPKRCPHCRNQQRLAFRNERALYKRACDLCKKQFIAIYDADAPFPVYCNECWWSDRWDALSYGRAYDFSRPFFEQFADLLSAVPKAGILQVGSENAEYNSCLGYCKNVYMCPGCYHVEDSLYVRKSEYSKDCLNSSFLDRCELVSYSVNSSGDYLQSCKNATWSFDCFDVEDSAYLFECVNVKDSMDLTIHDKGIERCYQCIGGGENNRLLKFAVWSVSSPESEYLFTCVNCPNCFGCDSINKRNQFCILNKRYSKEEYFNLRSKIIEHMKATGEYGEFFPISISPHSYNESLAQDYYPLSEAEVLKKGWHWKKEAPGLTHEAQQFPSRSEDFTPSLIARPFACEICGKAFKVISQELELCKKLNVTPSPACADCRQRELIRLKNPRMLWNRSCAKCAVSIYSTYSPDRPEIVLCEGCYLTQ